MYEEGAQAAKKEEKPIYQKRSVATLIAMGRTEPALSAIGAALAENPKDSELRMTRAVLLLDQSKIDAALADLQQLDQEQKNNAGVKYQLGRALLLKGKPKEAVDRWQEAVKLQPSYLEPKIALATNALQSRKFDDVQRIAGEILNSNPNNVAAQILRADALAGAGQQQEAKALLTRLREQFPGNQAVDLEYAFLLLNERKAADAEKIFRSHYTPGQAGLRPLTGLAESLLAQKRNEEAIRLLQADLAKAPGRSDVEMMLANTQAISAQPDAAIRTLENAVSAHPDDAQILIRLGQLQSGKGNLDAAVANFQKARELAPQSPAPILNLAEAEERLGKSDAARQAYQDVLKIDPGNLVALNNLAYLTADSGGNLDEALRLITTASQKVPKQPNLADTLGYVYLKQNKVSSALQVFGDLAQQYPTNATFRFHHALALIQSGSKEQARKELEADMANKTSADLASKIKQALGRTS